MRARQLLRKIRRSLPGASLDDPDTVKRLLPHFTIDELEKMIILTQFMIEDSRAEKAGGSREPRAQTAPAEFRRIVMSGLRQEKIAQRRGTAFVKSV